MERDIMNEIWRDVPGYEGLYQVSNYGGVRSMNYNKKLGNIRELKQKLRDNGYLEVHLSKDSKRKYFLVHRLVAEAFLENPDNKPQVNHIDGDKSNNYVSNLEYTTNGENQKHAYSTRLKNAQGAYEANRKSVRCITTGKEFDSITEAALYYNIKSNSKICNCCKKQQKYAGKYNGQRLVWEYIN